MKTLRYSIFTIVAFASLAMTTSCSTSTTALQQLRTINNRIQTEGSSYGINDWKNVAKDYYDVDKKIVKYTARGKYSDEEVNEIGSLQSQCIKGFKNGVKENVTDKIGTTVQFIKGIIDGWKN